MLMQPKCVYIVTMVACRRKSPTGLHPGNSFVWWTHGRVCYCWPGRSSTGHRSLHSKITGTLLVRSIFCNYGNNPSAIAHLCRPVIGTFSAIMATAGVLLYWILALYDSEFHIPGVAQIWLLARTFFLHLKAPIHSLISTGFENKTCGSSLLPLTISDRGIVCAFLIIAQKK